MDLASQLNVAVIGAGYAGLAAAVNLAERGVRVTVCEASRSLGGRARRVDAEGTPLDNGQHLLVGAYDETLRMLHRVGVDADRALRRQPLRLAFADGFTLAAPSLPAPLHLAWALLRAPLAFSERRAAFDFMKRLKGCRFRIDAGLSVAELLDRGRQPATLRTHLWEPLCLAALNTPPAEASAQVFANVLRDSLAGPRAASDLLLPATDLGSLFPEPAAAFVTARGGRVLRECRVHAICRTERGFELRGSGLDEPFSHVVVAVAPYHAASILAGMPELAPLSRQVAGLRHEPIATAYLTYGPAVRLPAPMLGLTSGHAQWLFDHGAISGRPGLLAAVISAAGHWQDLPRDRLVAAIHEQISGIAGPIPSPSWSRLFVEKRATFACTPGLARPGTHTAIPGLLLAGDYVACDYPATIEAAVRSGLRAARSILDETPVREA